MIAVPDQKRFETISSETSKLNVEGSRVLRDRETGVCYLFHWAGYAGGLTVLLDADGSPVVVRADSAETD